MTILLAFASCDSGDDSDRNNSGNDISSPTLPASIGKNPVLEILGGNTETKEIKLQKSDHDKGYEFLVLKADDTALYYYCDEIFPSEDDYLAYEYKYSWNTEKREIYVAVRKTTVLDVFFEDNIGLLDYDAAVSKLNSFSEKDFKKIYEADEEYWNETYNCENYKDYIDKRCAEEDCENVADLIKKINEEGHVYLKRIYKAITTFGYEIKDDKMTLTEQFTGVKNLLGSRCVIYYRYNEYHIDDYGMGYGCSSASMPDAPVIDIDPETLYDKIGEKVYNDDYTEDIEAETVTMKIDNKELVFKFEGEAYTQVSK